MDKPFSQACENNKQPILDVISRYATTEGLLNEIGSGTGQHAVFMAANLPHLQWQPSDVSDNLPGIHLWRNEANLPNLGNPVSFNVDDSSTPLQPAHYLYSANTLHIMGWPSVERFFSWIPQLLQPDGIAFFYGPFNYNGQFTSESNARFNIWLKERGEHQGIRDFEAIAALAAKAGLELLEDCAMPANNRTLVWRRVSQGDS